LAADVIYENGEAVHLLLESMLVLLKRSTDAEILLSFARRNVPVHIFLSAAEKRGLSWQIAAPLPEASPYVYNTQSDEGWVDVRQSDQPTEPIYSLKWASLP
jgi:hypothetical protein